MIKTSYGPLGYEKLRLNVTGGTGGDVNKIIAGNGITVSPDSGTGDVTVSVNNGIFNNLLNWNYFDYDEYGKLIPRCGNIVYRGTEDSGSVGRVYDDASEKCVFYTGSSPGVNIGNEYEAHKLLLVCRQMMVKESYNGIMDYTISGWKVRRN